MNLKTLSCLVTAACSLFTSAVSTFAQGTAFTYQGQLQANGSPASGNYDFTFSLFATNSTNSGQVGATITNLDVNVSKGLFMVTLDFGENFPGASRWLAIGVRTNGASTFTALNPLQELQPTPYAIYSSNAAVASSALSATTAASANSVAASNINGTVPFVNLPSNLALLNSNQTFTGANTFSNSVTFNTGAGTLQVVNDSGVVPGLVASGGLASGHMRFRNGLEVWPTSTPTNGGYLDVRGTNTPNSPTITLTGNTGAIVASNVTASFSGNGGNLTGLNASQLTSGQVPLAQLPPVITNGQSAVTLSNVTLTGVTVVSSNITSSGYPYLFYDGQNNFFAGPFAGNPTTGNDNTAIGNSAMYNLSSASSNTAVGNSALFSNTTGNNNTATGNGSLFSNSTGTDSTANGYQTLYSNVSGSGNTAAGFHSMLSGTNASDNTGYGVGTLLANLNGNNSTAIGYQALRNVPNGSNNIALGFQSGSAFNASENGNIDIGNNGVAGDNNIIRIGNNQIYTYIAGAIILNGDIDGNLYAGTGAGGNYGGGALVFDNTAVGSETLTNPLDCMYCTAVGYQALANDGGGTYVIGIGYRAGINVKGGYRDIFIGNQGVGEEDQTIRIGDSQTNTYIAGVINGNGFGLTNLNASQLSGGGTIPLSSLPDSVITTNETYANLIAPILNGDIDGNFYAGTGAGGDYNGAAEVYDNTAVGYETLTNPVDCMFCTAVGYQALANDSGGTYVIGIGYQAGINIKGGYHDIFIGNQGVGEEDQTIRIGDSQTNTYIAGIAGTTIPSGTEVVVSSGGRLGTLTSSARFKMDIQSMEDASDALLSLRPVTFKYKADIDPKGVPEFGLIAEEVEKVDPDLIVRDKDGRPYTVRYQAVNAMLLNEFQKQHKKIVQQEEEIQALKASAAKVDALERQLQELQEAVHLLAQKN